MQVLLDRIKKIEAEQKRRADSKLARYNRDKVHEKQMAFHRCMKRNRWVFGGNRSGKTECGAVETVWKMNVPASLPDSPIQYLRISIRQYIRKE